MMTPVGSGLLQRWLEARGVDVITTGRTLRIEPDVLMDFRALPYADGTFKLVAFDPSINSRGRVLWGIDWSDFTLGIGGTIRRRRVDGGHFLGWQERRRVVGAGAPERRRAPGEIF